MAKRVFNVCKCGNATSGDKVYKCDRCGQLHCSFCLGNRCKKCDKDWGSVVWFHFTEVGQIK